MGATFSSEKSGDLITRQDRTTKNKNPFPTVLHISHNLSGICYYCCKIIVFLLNVQLYVVNASAADVPCL
jgi:hypothetical protein